MYTCILKQLLFSLKLTHVAANLAKTEVRVNKMGPADSHVHVVIRFLARFVNCPHLD